MNFEWPKPVGGHPTLRDIVDMNDHNPSLAISKFELDRIDYHLRRQSLVIEFNMTTPSISPIQRRANMECFRSKSLMVL